CAATARRSRSPRSGGGARTAPSGGGQGRYATRAPTPLPARSLIP
ncbi:MAG: hypothetical protein AVDCRST_MAG18-4096, partial [uncultured Thermomicrobiales bacterium]